MQQFFANASESYIIMLVLYITSCNIIDYFYTQLLKLDLLDFINDMELLCGLTTVSNIYDKQRKMWKKHLKYFQI